MRIIHIFAEKNTSWGQFHQHFMSSFCVNILPPKNYKAKLQAQKSLRHKNIGATAAHKLLMKLIPVVNSRQTQFLVKGTLNLTRNLYRPINLTITYEWLSPTHNDQHLRGPILSFSITTATCQQQLLFWGPDGCRCAQV